MPPSASGRTSKAAAATWTEGRGGLAMLGQAAVRVFRIAPDSTILQAGLGLKASRLHTSQV
eukprot:9263938-Alexandrium_andersonii.AAC.1